MFSLFSAFRLKMLKLLRKLLSLPHPAVRQNCLESCSVSRARFLSTITAGLFIISISSIFVITQMIIKFRSWLSAMHESQVPLRKQPRSQGLSSCSEGGRKRIDPGNEAAS